MNKDCRICNNEIEAERIEVLPSTVFCSACAHIHNVMKPRKGVMIYSGKTAGEIQIMSAELYESQKEYYVPNGARSAVKNFSKSSCA